MKAAVFSDTHSSTILMIQAVRRIRPDAVIHLGDLERDAYALKTEFPEIPLYNVCGNCDVCPTSPESDVVPLGPIKAFICHGHQFNVKWGSFDSLAYAAMEKNCKIAMYGHTHVPDNQELGGVRIINPGHSGGSRSPTFALVEVLDNGGFTVEIKDL